MFLAPGRAWMASPGYRGDTQGNGPDTTAFAGSHPSGWAGYLPLLLPERQDWTGQGYAPTAPRGSQACVARTPPCEVPRQPEAAHRQRLPQAPAPRPAWSTWREPERRSPGAQRRLPGAAALACSGLGFATSPMTRAGGLQSRPSEMGRRRFARPARQERPVFRGATLAGPATVVILPNSRS